MDYIDWIYLIGLGSVAVCLIFKLVTTKGGDTDPFRISTRHPPDYDKEKEK